MGIHYNHQKKICTVWLTNAEKMDAALRESLIPLYRKNKEQGYLTAVYESGTEDLFEGTRDLLLYNRRRLAEIEIQREKCNCN